MLWQLAGLCTVMGWDLEDVARENLSKLADRLRRLIALEHLDRKEEELLYGKEG